MFKYCIKNNIIGTNRDLYIENNKATLTKRKFVNDCWALGYDDARLNISKLAKLCNKQVPTLEKKYLNMFKALNMLDDVQWKQLISKEVYNSYIHELTGFISSLINSRHVAYYTDVFLRIQDQQVNLGNACINIDRLNHEIKSCNDSKNRNALISFLPRSGCFADKVEYSMLSSVTGRLTISSGPAILTLKKQIRNAILKSRHNDKGKLKMIDYRAVEPTVIAKTLKIELVDNDVYLTLFNIINKIDALKNINIEQTKIAIITTLYGASNITISNITNLNNEVTTHLCKIINDFFQTSKLLDQLKDELKHDGYITNVYGRPIFQNVERKLIENYAQSSAVDVYMLGFSKIIEEMSRLSLASKAIFFIHDALIIDEHCDESHIINDIINGSLNDKKLGKFQVRYKEIV